MAELFFFCWKVIVAFFFFEKLDQNKKKCRTIAAPLFGDGHLSIRHSATVVESVSCGLRFAAGLGTAVHNLLFSMHLYVFNDVPFSVLFYWWVFRVLAGKRFEVHAVAASLLENRETSWRSTGPTVGHNGSSGR